MYDFVSVIDRSVLNFIKELQNPVLNLIMPLITALGNGGIIWIVTAAAALSFKKTRRCSIAIAAALLLVLISGSLILKPLIARPRPFMLDDSINLLINAPSDFSFPSGHTYSSAASAYVIYHFNKRYGIIAWILAGLIAFSRLYLMVHFLTDILGGTLLGILCGYTAVHLTNIKEKS